MEKRLRGSSMADLLFTPSAPSKSRTTRRRKPEAKVQSEIIKWLVPRGVILAVTDAGLLAKMGLGMSCGIPTGWPDLTACTPSGRFMGVECKAAGGRQSDEQRATQKRIEDNGGLYVLAHSLEELVAELRKEELCGNTTGISLL
jgi:hypothetical protein